MTGLQKVTPRQAYRQREALFQGSRLSIFFAIAPLQTLSMQQLIVESPADTSVCLDYSGMLSLGDDCKALHVDCSATETFACVQDYFFGYRLLKFLGRRFQAVDVYLPHCFHAMANYVVFFCDWDRLYLLPDGLLNYYRWDINDEHRRRMCLKAVFSRCLGGRYAAYEGSLTGGDQISFDGSFMYSRIGLVSDYGDYFPLSAPLRSSNPEAGTVLFLDHPIDYLDTTEKRTMQRRNRDYLLPFTTFDYKPHPKQHEINIDSTNDLNMKTVDENVPAEILIAVRGYSHVVSMCSSGLLMAKILYPDVTCTSVGLDLLKAYDPELEEIERLMDSLDIELV